MKKCRYKIVEIEKIGAEMITFGILEFVGSQKRRLSAPLYVVYFLLYY